MDEVKQQYSAQHLLPEEKGSKLPVVLAVILLLFIAAYAGLCVWVSMNGRILPNVQVGTSQVGGMTVAAAARQIEADADARFSPCAVQLTYGANGSVTVPGSYITADGYTAALTAYAAGRSGFPALYGFNYLKALTGTIRLELPITLNSAFSQGSSLLDNAFLGHETAMVRPAYTIGETDIQVRKGTPSYQYDRNAVNQLLMQAIVDASNGDATATVHADPVRIEPEDIDWDAVAAQVFVTPADAALDPEAGEIIPSVTGVSLNVAQARRLYAQAGDGDSLTVPLTFTEPDVTTEELEATLFKDVLGQADSYVSGVSNRVSNVKLAGELCHGAILMPGDEFSYWDMIAPCTLQQGFLPAPTYLNGLTVDGIGGGICQMSSSIYYAALHANLEILERRNHTYAVGYLPDGGDAMVSSGSSDFRFKNNTASPIQIVVSMTGRNLSVQILGTKADDTYVKMQFIRLSTTPYETIYKADPSIPAGTTKESVTPYTGRKVEAYRCVYNADGSLLSKTLESVNSYRKRDRVILCSPDDLHLYDPTAANPTPPAGESPAPGGSSEPIISPAPTISLPPAEESASPSASPADSGSAAGDTVASSDPSAELSQPAASPSTPPADGFAETGEASQ